MLKPYAFAVLSALVGAGSALAEDEERRDFDAHEHGRGAMNVAIEGDGVWLELEAPGSDIVGFEHEAHSDEDKAAIAAAVAMLEQPLELFVIPEDAGCDPVSAHVEALDDAHENESDDHAEEDAHGEFHAEYELACSNTAAIDRIDFTYFEAFAGAETLSVTILSDTGQAILEVSRDDPIAVIETGR
ncbi:MAG: DUF2796 domain-containing protein [Alphaproteobacteria bacterium]|nr:DUF2796 domain-containing protein [Alphaproteobacteria bacterium]